MYDVVIIGAGIIGSLLAYDLSRYDLNVAVLEKNHDIANETTMANSAIIHTGYDPEENTLKALLNPLGARRYSTLCQDLQTPYQQIGSFVAACGLEEEAHLDILEKRAEERGIACVRMDAKQAREQEPNLSSRVSEVLFFPETAIVYPWLIAQAALETAIANGTKLFLDSPVVALKKEEPSFQVITPNQVLNAKVIVNAAGLGAEKVMALLEEPSFTMIPKRGEYFVLEEGCNVVRSIVFPVPSAKGKGVLCIPTVYGNTLVGPTSQVLETAERDAASLVSTTQAGLDQVKQEANKVVENIPFGKVIRSFSGVRPSTNRGDFILEESQNHPGFILAAGIDSPGLASAPAISEYLIEHFISKHVDLKENPQAIRSHEAMLPMRLLSLEERQAKIAQNPLYGKIVCRCMQVSEGEIIDAIHSSCGARSIKGVKKRVGPGFGRCQGGFCEPLVVDILARELNLSPLEVVLDEPGSQILEEVNR